MQIFGEHYLRATQIMGKMTPFVYREFYDVPRLMVVRQGLHTFLLDCSFSEDDDDYAPEYSVYLMSELNNADLAGDWRTLNAKSLGLLGKIRVSDVRFDLTKRKEFDSSVLAKFVAGGNNSIRAESQPTSQPKTSVDESPKK